MRATRICCASDPRVTLGSIWVRTRPLPLSPGGFGAAGRNLMKDEGRAPGGLDPVREWGPPQRARRGRGAAKGAEFGARLAGEVAVELELVVRKAEGTLAAAGCRPLIDPAADAVFLFDMGGGSWELVWLDRSSPTGRGPPLPKIKAWAS